MPRRKTTAPLSLKKAKLEPTPKQLAQQAVYDAHERRREIVDQMGAMRKMMQQYNDICNTLDQEIHVTTALLHDEIAKEQVEEFAKAQKKA